LYGDGKRLENRMVKKACMEARMARLKQGLREVPIIYWLYFGVAGWYIAFENITKILMIGSRIKLSLEGLENN
jgi:hypothetical protein